MNDRTDRLNSEPLTFTGERFVPEVHGNIELEHLHRYLQACEIATDKVILDIACGEGYGSDMLAKHAAKVIGVDISAEAVEHAKRRYQRANLEYLEGSCAAIPLPDASVDMVVSYETIEHHYQHEEMMQEIQRVLRPNGLLLISSPDKYYYSDEPNYSNPHHVKELYEDEFKQLLEKYFKQTTYFGQRIIYGSAILAEASASPSISYRHDNDKIKNQSGLINPVYWIALASNGDLPTLSCGIFDQPINDSEIVRSWSVTTAERDTQIARLNNDIAKYSLQTEHLNDQVIRQGLLTQSLQAELLAMQKSHSWQITKPLREAARWARHPKDQGKHYAKKMLPIVKMAYQSLPISPETKAKHRSFIAKNMPWLFLARGTSSIYSETIQPLLVSTIPAELTPEELDAFARTITIPTTKEPIVSIVIPVYGKCNYTLYCLRSIAENSPTVPYEVIVIDDYSPDDSANILRKVKGITVISNSKNQGFIRSCNAGAKAAHGKYICFLNNDTAVTTYWLDELHRTFHDFPNAGFVGSKLIYPDGFLQEAGGIIWQDGSAWNFGRNQDPRLPMYNYAREVDYCSGASVMVPTALFEELGSFDEHYLPAYCEDSDLALKIRDHGYSVIYQPLSVVFHYEGITSGTDTAQGAKAYQIENSKKLFERWRNRLASHQPHGTNVDNAKDRTVKRRVLVMDSCTPTPDQDAGSVSLFNIMMLLKQMDFQVTFIPEDNFLYASDYTKDLQRMGIEVLYRPYFTSVNQHLKASGSRYDLVCLFRPDVAAQHLPAVRRYCSRAKVLFYTHDLHFLRMSREASLLGDAKKQKAADDMKHKELEVMKSVDASIVVSTAELELLQPELPNEKIFVFPLILDIPGTNKSWKDRNDIVFVGGYQHTPNVDAVLYFVREIMPLLRQRLPDVRFHIVGSNPPPQIQELNTSDVIVTGYVKDLSPLLDQMRLSVAPLRYGAGIKGKIGTALAAGLPTVATPLAAEGMTLTHGMNVLIAEGSEAWADAIAHIYRNESLWSQISANGIEFADKAWGAEAARESLNQILSDMGFATSLNKIPLRLYTSH